MLLVGLTGGIASGKTLVSDAFKALGIPVIDADIVAREVVAKGSAGLQQLVEHFGTDILTNDGELDRATLRQLIFSNPEHRKTVDGLLHPLIRERSNEQINKARTLNQPYAIYAVPLLVETAQQDRFDRIVVVDVPEAVQIDRLMTRDGGSKDKAEAILKAQASRSERLAIADDVINNDGPKEDTLRRVVELHEQYVKLVPKSAG